MAGTRAPNSVLIVDDSEDIHVLIGSCLQPDEYALAHAYDAEAGLAAARSHRPDLLLLDLNLPGVDGLEVCRQFRNDPLLEGVPIIFLTGTTDVRTKVAALNAGAVDYVTKPFDLDELRARVQAALRTALRNSVTQPSAGDTRESRPRRIHEGDVLAGRFKLERMLGAGGMGEVYRAKEIASARPVAVKILREEHCGDPECAERFRREARAAQLVRHPNVVDVLEVGADDRGVPFIVQELLRGQNLAQRIARGPARIPAVEAVALLTPVIDALALAHRNGVIHRDLKPSNIFLHTDERAAETAAVVPKVVDFGVSKIALRPDERRMTTTGMLIGTPAYMSPEAIHGTRSIDGRADVWSFGVVLYEVLAGRLPFDSDRPWGLFSQIVSQEPVRPLGDFADVPASLARIVDRCLRRDPDDRYPRADDVVAELRAAVADVAG